MWENSVVNSRGSETSNLLIGSDKDFAQEGKSYDTPPKARTISQQESNVKIRESQDVKGEELDVSNIDIYNVNEYNSDSDMDYCRIRNDVLGKSIPLNDSF